ncbi:MAG TPA: hypothetical protein PLB89_09490 [Flavobacteriales bacterium]|nr:hypothetical protein [Flavobacteriales bacterium]
MSSTKNMDLAFAALLSKDADQVLTALARIEKGGDARAIRPLLHALATTQEDHIRQRITKLLNEVKVMNATDELLLALDEPALASVRVTVLSVFWNAGLDVRDHLDRFVTIALDGNGEECFECLTVIENQEIWPERATRSAAARVRKALPDEGNSYKASLLNDLLAVLEYRLGTDEGQ